MRTDPFIYWEFIRKVLRPLPGVVEGFTHDTPSFHVGKKFMLRLKEDNETLAIYNEEREKWMAKDPNVFFITPHYQNYAYVLVNLAKIDPPDLEQLLLDAWRARATKTLIKAYNNS